MKKFLKIAGVVLALFGVVTMQSCEKDKDPLNPPTEAKYRDLTSVSVTLYWSGDAPAYEVLLNTGSFHTVSAGGTTLELTDLTPNTSYTWEVRSTDDSSTSGYVAGEDFKTPDTGDVPDAPGGLSVTNVGYDNATLSWKAAENAAGYEIEINGESYNTTEIMYIARDLEGSTDYTWRVRSIRRGRYSEWVNGLPFTTSAAPVQPDAPTGLTVVRTTAIGAELTWTEVDNATSYQVQFNNMPTVTRVWNADENTYNMTHLMYETNYSWSVRSVNGDLRSEWVGGPSFTTEDIADGIHVFYEDEPAWNPLPETIQVYSWGRGAAVIVDGFKTLRGPGKYSPGFSIQAYNKSEFSVFKDEDDSIEFAGLWYFSENFWNYPTYVEEVPGDESSRIYLGDWEPAVQKGYAKLVSNEGGKVSLVATTILTDRRSSFYSMEPRPDTKLTVVVKNMDIEGEE